jgi:hypothetical protein
MGNFTNMALAAQPDSRVIAVEPSIRLNNEFQTSVGLNDGFLSRVKLFRAFVGAFLAKQERVIVQEAKDYSGAGFINEREIIEAAGGKVDFLKCDIEGGEFGLLVPGSQLLRVTRKLACEVHGFAGPVDDFIEGIRQSGFRILFLKRDPDGTTTFLARRVSEG